MKVEDDGCEHFLGRRNDFPSEQCIFIQVELHQEKPFGRDPMELGTAASVITLVEVALRTITALHEYTSNTRNASTERKLLAEETWSLSQILKRLHGRASDVRLDDPWLEQRRDLLRQLSRAYDELCETLKIDLSSGELKSESKLKAAWTVGKWSFTKAEIYALLERVSRLQLYANTFLLDEQHFLVEQIDQRQQDDRAAKQKSVILEWLTPLRMTSAHETISKRPEAGSGRWFLTSSEFRKWQERLNSRLWCSGIRMFPTFDG